MAEFKRLGAMYSRLGLQTPTELVSRRMEAAPAVLKAIAKERVPTLVRVAFGLTKPQEADFLVKGFSDADPTFHLFGDDAEVRLLATAVLAEMVEAPGSLAATCALAVVAASFGGVRPLVHEPELAFRAAERLADFQAASSRPPVKRKATREPPDVTDEIQAIKGVTAPQQVPTIAANAAQAIETLADYVVEVERDAVEREDALLAYIRALEAETRLQWWVTSRWSEESDEPFRGIEPAAAAILAGVELADRGGKAIGAVSAPALLDMVLEPTSREGMTKPIALTSAATAPRIDWRRELPEGLAASPDAALVPITLAMALAADSGDEEDWIPRFRRATSLDPTSTITPMHLARQVYLERLLARRCAIGDE